MNDFEKNVEKTLPALNVTELEKDPSGNPVFYAEYDERVLSDLNLELVRNHEDEKSWRSEMYLHINEENIFQSGQPIKFEGTKILFDDQGKPQFFLFSQDIDRFLMAEKDPLTKILNREGWKRRLMELAESIQRGEMNGKYITLGMFDLNDLKKINDASEDKHKGGDRALIEMAEFLSENTRAVDIVARWGGDEFAIAAKTKSGEVLNIKKKLESNKQTQVSFSGGLFEVSADELKGSINFNGKVESRTGLVYEQLVNALKKADQLMYNAKQKGKGLSDNRSGRTVSMIFTNKDAMNTSPYPEV